MPERQCGTCKRQKEWGCTAKRWRFPGPDEADGPENWIDPGFVPNDFNGEDLFSCPRQTLKEDAQDWNRLLLFYGMYLKGYLPETGAIADQPNWMIQAFRVLDEANAECDRQEQEKEQRLRAASSGGR